MKHVNALFPFALSGLEAELEKSPTGQPAFLLVEFLTFCKVASFRSMAARLRNSPSESSSADRKNSLSVISLRKSRPSRAALRRLTVCAKNREPL
jgi:hypothetical protein